jgi:hypothetical protein
MARRPRKLPDVDSVNFNCHPDNVNNVHIGQREADEMIDFHLINVVLASLGISAAAAVLIAAAVIGIAAVGRHQAAARRGQPTPAPATVPASARATVPSEESSRPGHARREPALR